MVHLFSVSLGAVVIAEPLDLKPPQKKRNMSQDSTFTPATPSTKPLSFTSFLWPPLCGWAP